LGFRAHADPRDVGVSLDREAAAHVLRARQTRPAATEPPLARDRRHLLSRVLRDRAELRRELRCQALRDGDAVRGPPCHDLGRHRRLRRGARECGRDAAPPRRRRRARRRRGETGAGGRRRPRRDAGGVRVVDEVRRGTGGAVTDPAEVGGWPWMASATPPVDGDHDGMPDWWEALYGLNRGSASDGARDADGDGYTNVEEFLNSTSPPFE